jgi:regulatory protein
MTRKHHSGSVSDSPSEADPEEHARQIALRILTHSARSSAQLREGLTSRGVAPELAERLVVRYTEVGLLDDRGLARTIARTRHAERGVSRQGIRVELVRKGFDPAHIDDALAQIDDEDERLAALALAQKRWSSLAGDARDRRQRKVMGLLGRKGYSPSVAWGVVKSLESADVEVNDDCP